MYIIYCFVYKWLFGLNIVESSIKYYVGMLMILINRFNIFGIDFYFNVINFVMGLYLNVRLDVILYLDLLLYLICV